MAQPWPSSLQQLLNKDSFEITFANTTLTTEMDIGVPKRRRRYTKGVKLLTCSIWVNQSQYTILENFYETTLNGGVDSFEFNHPITGVLTQFKFSSPPKATYMGGDTFPVVMAWEIQP